MTNKALDTTSLDLPLLHRGKVRDIYQLGDRLLFIATDRISAFDCIWHGEGGMRGVPGKGAALNAISNHWFRLFREQGLADSHILEIPHPQVWIVQKARPVMIEAIDFFSTAGEANSGIVLS